MTELDRSERDPLARALPADVATALAVQGRAGATGTLLVTGDPGGLLRLDGGRVTGVESPGAPGVEALLLRSGRVLEASWVAAYQAGAPHGRFAVELVRRGLVGGAELEAVCLMALFDAAFALAAGTVEGCRWEPSPVGATGKEPWTREVARVDVEQLCAEVGRRLGALAALPTPVRPGRDRLGPTGSTTRALTGLRREVLGLADGRRTARDIAFLLGRGVYPVTVEASRLMTHGLLRVGAGQEEGGTVRALLAPRHAATAGSLDLPALGDLPAPSDPPALGGPVQLPRRPSRASGS